MIAVGFGAPLPKFANLLLRFAQGRIYMSRRNAVKADRIRATSSAFLCIVFVHFLAHFRIYRIWLARIGFGGILNY